MYKSSSLVAAALLLLATSPAFAQLQGPRPNPADPKYQSKGEQDRTYVFPGTDENIAYRIYVPSKWDKNTRGYRSSF